MIRCKKCNNVSAIVKTGIVRGSQRYRCKDCGIYFTFDEKKQKQNAGKEATVKDIAKALKISVSTVSRALHDNAEISEKTRKLVLAKAAELDYQPNDLAYALSTKKTNRIGIIVPEINYHFFPRVINAASEVFINAGYNVLIANTNNHYDLEVSNAKNFLSNKVEGLLVSLSSETANMDHFASFINREIPIVFFNRVPVELEAYKVAVDDYAAAVKVVTHLVKQGYKKIAHVCGPPNLLISTERLRGYRDTLKKFGLPVKKEYVIKYSANADLHYKSMHNMLASKSRPDAIFSFNDPMALELIMLAKSMNIIVPDQLGIAGFSNEPAGMYIQPSLTTIHHPLEEMGMLAAELLIDQIQSRDIGVKQKRILETQLVVRDSTNKKHQ